MSEDFPSFTDEAVQRCPFPLIKRAHAEAPVYRDPTTGFFVVTRYDDIVPILEKPAVFSNTTTVVFGNTTRPGGQEVLRLYEETGWPRMHTLTTADPPEHTRYRKMADKVFTPSFVKQLEPEVTKIVDELIDAFIDAGTVDLRTEFGIKLPMFVISDQLGVPREKWQMFKLWSDSAIALVNPGLTREKWLELAKINIEMQHYLVAKRDEYEAEPAEKLLSMLAHVELDGERLTTREFVSLSHQFLVAGNETTTGALVQAVAMLIQDPGLMQRVRADLSLLPGFIEESLRIHAPSPHLYRLAKEDVTVGGVDIPAGSVLMISYLAGNHDESRFACPDDVDLGRKGIRNHLSFGRGIHHCIGHLLARSELRIGLTRLLERLEDIRFDPAYPEPKFAALFHIHQLDSLHITFRPADQWQDKAA